MYDAFSYPLALALLSKSEVIRVIYSNVTDMSEQNAVNGVKVS